MELLFIEDAEWAWLRACPFKFRCNSSEIIIFIFSSHSWRDISRETLRAPIFSFLLSLKQLERCFFHFFLFSKLFFSRMLRPTMPSFSLNQPHALSYLWKTIGSGTLLPTWQSSSMQSKSTRSLLSSSNGSYLLVRKILLESFHSIYQDWIKFVNFCSFQII